MLFVSKKYESLDTMFEDEVINEAERNRSDYSHLRNFLDSHAENSSIKELLLYLCDEVELNKEVSKHLSEDKDYNIAKWWKENKKDGDKTIQNKYIIKAADKNAAIYSTKHVIKGVDDVYTLLSKDFTIEKIQDLSGGGVKVKLMDKDDPNDYVTVNIDYTGKDALNNKGSAFPNATEMEMVIAFAYNKNYTNLDDDANAKFVGIYDKDKSKYTAFYNGNTQLCQKMAALIRSGCRNVGFPADSLKKMQTKDVSGVTQAWNDAGSFDKKNKANLTPKTDLISGDGKCKLSLKNADEGAQAMSGGFRESRATMMCVLSKLFSNYSGEVNGIKLSSLSAEVKDALEEVKDQAQDIVDKGSDEIDDASKDFIDRVGNLFKEIKNIKNNSSFFSNVTKSKGKKAADIITFAAGSWLDSTKDDDLDDAITNDPELKALLFKDGNKDIFGNIINYVNGVIKKTGKKGQKEINDITLLTRRHVKQFVHNQMAKELYDILNNNEEFRKAVMREAMTGEIKYGVNSPATANAVLVWSYNGDCKVENIYEYADKHSRMSSDNTLTPEELSEIIEPTINFKGSSGKSYSAMRIAMKKTKLAVDINNVINGLTADLEEVEKQEESELKTALQNKLKQSIEMFKNEIGDKLDQQSNTPTQDSDDSDRPVEIKPQRKSRRKTKS